MDSDMILEQEISDGLPEELRPFLPIAASPLPRAMQPTIKAFWTAATALQRVTRIRKRVLVVFSTAPFKVTLPNSTLTVDPRADSINMHLEDLAIFVDCIKLERYEVRFRVVCILEEFVHVFMNISDEGLVTEVVGLIYDGIEVRNGQYTLPSTPAPTQ